MNTIKTKIIIIITILLIIFTSLLILHIDNKEKINYNNNIKIEENLKIDSSIESIPSSSTSIVSRSNSTQTYENLILEEDIILLAKLINCEAGSNWCTNEHQQLVARVAINRSKIGKGFPSTIKGVIFQKGQYTNSINSNRWKEYPPLRCITNAKIALDGINCPNNVVFQAEFKQGSKVYKKFLNPITKKYTYFCYL